MKVGAENVEEKCSAPTGTPQGDGHSAGSTFRGELEVVRIFACNVREREEVGRRRTGERFTALVHAHVAVNALRRVVRGVRSC